MNATASGSVTRTVTQGVRLGYGVGSFCTGTWGAVPGLLLLYYMTNIMAVPAWLAGIVVTAPKAWDLVANPLIGRWSDRTRSRLGPRRPWLLAGALTLPVAFTLTFAGPPITGAPAAIYVGVCFLLSATAYSVFEVPYKTMSAEMTGDYHERTSLLQWRMVFVGVATAISGIAAPAIVNAERPGGTPESYRLMAVFVALVMLAAMLGAFFGTARAPAVIRAAPQQGSLFAQLSAARGNGPFWWLLAIASSQTLSGSVMLAGAPYFATYIMDDPKATSTLFAALVIPLLLTMPMWVWLARRLDKRGAMILAGLLLGGGTAAAMATPVFGTVYTHLTLLVAGVGLGGVQLMQFSMLADVVAADAATTGRRRAGMFTGLWTAIESGVSAFGTMIFAAVLTVGGFISSDPSRRVTQPAGAEAAIMIGQCLVPAVIILMAVLMTFNYRLTADRVS
ncbi:MFS transporter [Spongiactinospora rosea]|uniref:MFS transporter n=1 Tax=Spongiactinospora rosea TaxID=2248750 RepID=A0A366LKC9_9ACTN|nr:MFS transporter [Spongiactinospora rosea]RBQ14277.1 MFS transporter [Spongiactinospora rosea]